MRAEPSFSGTLNVAKIKILTLISLGLNRSSNQHPQSIVPNHHRNQTVYYGFLDSSCSFDSVSFHYHQHSSDDETPRGNVDSIGCVDGYW